MYDVPAMSSGSSVVLFDGHCNLCCGTVVFILRRDPGGRFRFASLQSHAGQNLLRRAGYPPDTLETVVLIENERAFDRSTAALRIARRLGSAWPLLYAFILIPRPLRDAVYAWVARHRYRWFGRRDQCLVPTGDMAGRFLE